MRALFITLAVIYAIGLLFTVGLAVTNFRTGVVRDDSKSLVVFIYLLVWILSPALLIDFIWTTIRAALKRRK